MQDTATRRTQRAQDRLAAMTSRVENATPGDWFWGGNTEYGDLELRTHSPGSGVMSILSNIPVHLTREEALQRTNDAYVVGAEYREWYTQELLDHPKNHLAFLDDGLLVDSRETAIYAVARAQGLPDTTPADHPKVYRHDVCGSTNANAQLIEHAAADLRATTAALRDMLTLADERLREDPADALAAAMRAAFVEHLGDTERRTT